MQQNIDMKWREKLRWYRQLAYGYTVTIVPVITGDLGDGMKKTMNELTKLFTKQELAVKTEAKMQKTILMDSEALLRKVFYGLAKSDKEENRFYGFMAL